jgi:hypothetical protein
VSLPDWLADPALAPVWSALHGPVSRGTRTSRLRGLSRETRHALGGVLGRPVVGDVTVTLAELSELLTTRAGLSLDEVVVAATGRPLRSAADDRAARQEPLDVLGAEYADAVRGLSLTPELARDAVRVLASVGAPRLRTELAASCAGDAHALDDGRPLATVVLRCLAASYDAPAPRSTAERRELWERAGVLADAVSSTVLTLGLRPVNADPRAARLRAAAELGDPVHLSAWDVRRTPLALDPSVPVLVCENPAVLEAFAVQRGGAQPVVCTAGWPAAVAVELLDRLGAPLRYHGDFDWRGVEICAWLTARAGVVPWRMTAADYLAARGEAPLKGREVATPWEPQLAEAMRERGVAVYEEQVLKELLEAWPGV